ncbi:MAG: small multi-drug export protein [Candidatus Omnitrophica bacterium]|nr:small multi-drug export protein [Candidatus Omnitrophota bacterium]
MEFILRFPKEIAVIFVGMLPVFELRGAIPLGFYFGMPVTKAFVFSIIGNLLIVAPLYFLLQPLFEKLRHIRLFNNFFSWLFKYTKERARIVEKYEALGLILFVAIPLPITGAWTATIAASLFKIRFKITFLAITCGVILAGLIVSVLVSFGWLAWEVFV